MQWTLAIRAAALAGAALVPGTMAPSQPAAAAAGQALDYELPAQDLGDMLRAIARKSGQEILFEAETVRGFRSPAVSGHYSFEQAIRAALAGSDTLAVEYRDGAALIRQRPGDAGPEPRLPDAGGAITVTGSRIRGAGSASPVTVATRRELERSGIADLAEFTRILPQNYTGGR